MLELDQPVQEWQWPRVKQVRICTSFKIWCIWNHLITFNLALEGHLI
jgi:hypothetical protein